MTLVPSSCNNPEGGLTVMRPTYDILSLTRLNIRCILSTLTDSVKEMFSLA